MVPSWQLGTILARTCASSPGLPVSNVHGRVYGERRGPPLAAVKQIRVES